MDTVFDTEKIKWELWRVVYGVWNYFKNSGKFPEAANLTLEWVGTIPGKRESRRFEGDYMLNQGDLVGQRQHEDAVAYGGWALDLHPADGVYSDLVPCTHYHAKGPYPVPYRAMYSRNITNLFLAGRVLSCSHVAFGSLRNMASLGYCAQAAGVAAALCVKNQLRPADLSSGGNLKLLQRTLLGTGQHIRGLRHSAPDDLALDAKVSASSEYGLRELPCDGAWIPLKQDSAQMLPLVAGRVPDAVFRVRASKATTLRTRFMISADADNHTPEKILGEASHELPGGEEREVAITCPVSLEKAQYGYFVLLANEEVEIRCTTQRMTGVLTVFHHYTQDENDQAGNKMRPRDIGIDVFELWSPRRRPDGENFAFRLSEPLCAYRAGNVVNGVYRPTSGSNAWVAAPGDANPALTLEWPAALEIGRLVLDFDPDWDHPMESVMKIHPERAIPFTVRDFQLETGTGEVILKVTGNYLARYVAKLPARISTSRLILRILGMNGGSPAAVFGIGVYA
jgi:hypothetical protein